MASAGAAIPVGRGSYTCRPGQLYLNVYPALSRQVAKRFPVLYRRLMASHHSRQALEVMVEDACG